MSNHYALRGYRHMAVGTEYIVVDETAIPISALAGHRELQCWYQWHGDKGRMIHTKAEPLSVLRRETHAAAVNAQIVAAQGEAKLDISDWK